MRPSLRIPTRLSTAILLCASAQKPSLKFHDVPADGDCLFSAVALSAALIDNKPDQARARALRTASFRLRSQANQLLCPNGAPDPALEISGLPVSLLMEPLGGETEADYCQRLANPGEWGSTAEILALTRVLSRPIRVHTAFGGVEEYGQPGEGAPLSIHFANDHYRAVTEETTSIKEQCDDTPPAATSRLRGGGGGGGPSMMAASADDEAAVASVLDSLHAAAASADASSYFKLFADSTTAVFLGTDASERWPIDEFREYATKRFEAGDGWLYEVLERHITVHASGEVAWFDERLMNAKLGSCRGSGVLVRDIKSTDPLSEANAWRIVQYNLAMAVPNDLALEVAELVKSKRV